MLSYVSLIINRVKLLVRYLLWQTVILLSIQCSTCRMNSSMSCTIQGYEKMISKLNFKHDKIVDIQKALHSADINNDKQVDFDEWRQDLKT